MPQLPEDSPYEINFRFAAHSFLCRCAGERPEIQLRSFTSSSWLYCSQDDEAKKGAYLGFFTVLHSKPTTSSWCYAGVKFSVNKVFELSQLLDSRGRVEYRTCTKELKKVYEANLNVGRTVMVYYVLLMSDSQISHTGTK